MNTFYTPEIAAKLSRSARILSDMPSPGYTSRHALPSADAVRELILTLRRLLFPAFYDSASPDARMRSFFAATRVDALFRLLCDQIEAAMLTGGSVCPEETARKAADMACEAVSRLTELKRQILTDISAIYHNDPAADSEAEIILCYPAVKAMTHYRFAHMLHSIGVRLLPRIITEAAHSETGIDIHPGATIGDHFGIDHGTGIVIGETCVIGRHVTVYQGVTLGARNFSYDSEGHPVNVPRHPVIEDNVTIYSNASVLGRVTVGHDSTIGGNVWLTHSVPPFSRIVQGRARSCTFEGGAGI